MFNYRSFNKFQGSFYSSQKFFARRWTYFDRYHMFLHRLSAKAATVWIIILFCQSQTRQAGYGPGPSRDNARMQINVNPIGHFLHLRARESSDSSSCGRPLSTLIWIHIADNVALASHFTPPSRLDMSMMKSRGPFLRILFALNLPASIIELGDRSMC